MKKVTAVLGLLTLVLTTGLLNSGQIRADLTDPISLETAFAAADPLKLLPNLNVLKPQDIQLSSSNGKTLLRFSMTSWNSGDGALEFVATGEGVGKQMNQRIYNDDGSTYVDYPATAISFEWHAAHGHFHVKNYANYDLKDAAGNGESKGTGSKTTFCIIDTDRINHKLPGASKKRQYSQCNDELQGMSVGWGDTYPYYLAGQEIDVTGLDTGDYRLIIDVNRQGHIKEKTLDDNSYEILLRIDVDAGTVEEVVDGDDGGGQGTGTVQGRVTTSTGAKISGAEVTVDGQFDLTNKGGKYSIADVTAGTQTITASSGGCTSQTVTVVVIANQNVKQDFVLGC